MGRVDRIGAKAEVAGQPIRIDDPFIAETQDEKMYRVVTDRERWFSVVMGEEYKVDTRTTEELAALREGVSQPNSGLRREPGIFRTSASGIPPRGLGDRTGGPVRAVSCRP
jgi:hypothetical protein